jgi:hypothetical protein
VPIEARLSESFDQPAGFVFEIYFCCRTADQVRLDPSAHPLAQRQMILIEERQHEFTNLKDVGRLLSVKLETLNR